MIKKDHIAKKLDSLSREWIINASLAGAGIFLFIAVLDLVATPENFRHFFAYRIIIAAFLILLWAIVRKIENMRYVYLLGHVGVFASAITIELMILGFGGHQSSYYAGLILLVVCVLAFIPAKLLFHAVNAVGIYLIYLLPIVAKEEIVDMKYFFTSNFFLLMIIGVSVTLRYLRNKSLEDQLGNEFDLEMHKHNLEQLIDERTADLSDALDRIKEVRDEWEETFNTINEAITIHDMDFNITRANKAAEELLGKSSPDFASMKCFKSYHGADAPPDNCPSCKSLETGEPSMFEIYEPHLNKHIEVKALPRHDSEGNLIGLVHVVRDISERRSAEENLMKANIMTNNILEMAPFGVYVVNRDGRIAYVNQAMLEISGTDSQHFIGVNVLELESYKEMGISDRIKEAFSGKQFRMDSVEYTSYYGKKKSVRNIIGIPMEKLDQVLIFVEDITDLKKAYEDRQELQLQLLQTQKIESVGRLAGGIAHDFNNILSSIIGFSELALRKHGTNPDIYESLSIVLQSGERAAELTSQLLAYSRKQILEIKAIDLNSVVENMSKMLNRTIGENISLHFNKKVPLKTIMADPGQMEQVLLNLAINARDAMAGGGRLIIETSEVEFDDDFVKMNEGSVKGSYVLLKVTDSGAGMPDELMEKIFEPFFTTKETGKGTGLGLSMVYGIVKQHNGYIKVESEPGKGSTFLLYIPSVEDDISEAEKEKDHDSMPGGNETVLVVEDDDLTRKMINDTLEPLGYVVINARDGEEALEKYLDKNKKVDLLLTDVVMPGISGLDLAERINKTDKEIKIIFMTGYADKSITSKSELISSSDMVLKPLRPGVIARKIREVLDR
ncbi:MAG: response regulator [Nitrospirota bacterium]|nr:MAG: response regulator [Nitrospirota bacterium]